MFCYAACTVCIMGYCSVVVVWIVVGVALGDLLLSYFCPDIMCFAVCVVLKVDCCLRWLLCVAL